MKQETITRTFKELIFLDSVIANLYVHDPKLRTSKFGYAYKRFYEKNLAKLIQDYRNEMADLAIMHASEDPVTKVVLTSKDGRGYEYSRQELLKLVKAERELGKRFDDMVVTIQPYILDKKLVPASLLEDDIRDIANGCIY